MSRIAELTRASDLAARLTVCWLGCEADNAAAVAKAIAGSRVTSVAVASQRQSSQWRNRLARGFAMAPLPIPNALSLDLVGRVLRRRTAVCNLVHKAPIVQIDPRLSTDSTLLATLE